MRRAACPSLAWNVLNVTDTMFAKQPLETQGKKSITNEVPI